MKKYSISKREIETIRFLRRGNYKYRIKEFNENGIELLEYEGGMSKKIEDDILRDIEIHLMDCEVEVENEKGEIIKGNFLWDFIGEDTRKWLKKNKKKIEIISEGQRRKIFDGKKYYPMINEKGYKEFYPVSNQMDYLINKLEDIEKYLIEWGVKPVNDFEEDSLHDFICQLLFSRQPVPTSMFWKAYRSNKRAYETIRDLLFSNLEKFDTFITLTFADEENKERHKELGLEFNYIEGDYDSRIEAYKKFVNNLSQNCKRKGIELFYVTVPEEHKKGDIHLHIVTSSLPIELIEKNPQVLSYNNVTNEIEPSNRINIWKHGKSDVQPIKDRGRLMNYILKYLLKDFLRIEEGDYEKYFNKKKYFASRNLAKPLTKYTNDNSYEFGQDSYEKLYFNAYNDNFIIKKVEIFDRV